MTSLSRFRFATTYISGESPRKPSGTGETCLVTPFRSSIRSITHRLQTFRICRSMWIEPILHAKQPVTSCWSVMLTIFLRSFRLRHDPANPVLEIYNRLTENNLQHKINFGKSCRTEIGAPVAFRSNTLHQMA